VFATWVSWAKTDEPIEMPIGAGSCGPRRSCCYAVQIEYGRRHKTVECPSVCRSRRSTAAAVAGGFAVEVGRGSRYRSVAAAAAAAVAQHAGRVNFDPNVRRSNILVLGEDPDPPREVARRCGYLPNYFDHSLPQM